MNVTINIYGDVHIHCDCCNECGEYDDNFDDALEAPHELRRMRRTTVNRSARPPKKRKRR